MPSRMTRTASSVERSRSVSSMRRMNLPRMVARVQPAKQRRAHAADVQHAGGAGGEARDDRAHSGGHGSGDEWHIPWSPYDRA